MPASLDGYPRFAQVGGVTAIAAVVAKNLQRDELPEVDPPIRTAMEKIEAGFAVFDSTLGFYAERKYAVERYNAAVGQRQAGSGLFGLIEAASHLTCGHLFSAVGTGLVAEGGLSICVDAAVDLRPYCGAGKQ